MNCCSNRYKKALFSKRALWGLSDGYKQITLMDSNFLLRSAQICKKTGNFRTITQEEKREARQMASFFSFTFWATTICDIHFCIWKMSKFIFMESALWSILVCKVPEFCRWNLWDHNFVLFDSGNIYIKEIKKPDFTFSIKLRTKFVWYHGLWIKELAFRIKIW